eukprot:m.28802 g.28802  ORF g.28802 m.28802 type:complete len:273 (+) comp40336_c0_seq2:264-1082(+)
MHTSCSSASKGLSAVTSLLSLTHSLIHSFTHALTHSLHRHTGPVWQVAWAHPKFGHLLASASFDKSVIIWKEVGSQWQQSFKYLGHESSVNAIAWMPHECDKLTLACASNDGYISLLTYSDGVWTAEKGPNAHKDGCTAISWAPVALNGLQSPRFVSGGLDNSVRVWSQDRERKWESAQLGAHDGWVRDVAWAPSVGFGQNVIASCSQDKFVRIWTEESPGQWSFKALQFPAVVWRTSWSPAGNVLAVSCGTSVTLWKQSLEGNWNQVSEIN